MFQTLQSRTRGISWPPLPDEKTAPLVALLHHLEETQWLPQDSIVSLQHKQLTEMAAHAEKYSPHFKDRLKTAGLRSGSLSSPEGLRKLPVLTRRELQSAKESFFCNQMPQAHAPLVTGRTSGSTGEPVIVRRTAINSLFLHAMNLREAIWHKRDLSGRYAVIRANLPAGINEGQSWGGAFSLLFDTGPSYFKSITTDVDQQLEWLQEIGPDYLLTYPTNLGALLLLFEQYKSGLPMLRQVRTIGETLTDEIRGAARKVLNVEIADSYSSEEFGMIAIQCPESGLYHVMSESLIVEVLDEQGGPCLPGQIGRVVITDLHNFATPLVRYEIGDYAEAGAACLCGRGLQVLKRIVGRQRNMLILPDGRRNWPLVGFHKYRNIAPIRQYQLIQQSRKMIEVRLVSDIPLTNEHEARLGQVIRDSLGHPFMLKFVYFSEKIPRSKGGKFEEFVCEAE